MRFRSDAFEGSSSVTTATALPDLRSLRDEQRLLRAQLRRLRGRLRGQLALELAVDAAAVLVATAAALVLLDWWFRPGLSTREPLLIACLFAVPMFLGVRLARRWRSAQVDDLSLALTLDRLRPGTGQRIADVLQLPDLLDQASGSSSPAMVHLAVRRASRALAETDWRSLWNWRRTALHAGGLLLATLVPLAFAGLAPEAARLSVDRWLRGSDERWPQRTYLTVMGLDDRGRLLVPRDEPVTLDVRADLPRVESRGGRWFVGGRGEPLELRRKPSRSQAPGAIAVRERAGDGARLDGVMTATGPMQFRYEFPPASASSTFSLTGGDDWLGPIRVDRVDRPSLAEIRLRVKEPGATYEGSRAIADPRQNLVFLPDTEVEMTLVGSEPIAATRLDVHPGTAPALSRVNDRTFLARWTLKAATTLEVLLKSGETGLDSRPSFLSLGILRDREPRIAVRATGVGGHVTPVATLPLTIAATDDLGLAALRLQADRTVPVEEKAEAKTTRQTINLPLGNEGGRPPLDQQVRHDVPLAADPPAVGTVLRFLGEAEDRCARGTQIGRSGVLQFQVVSPDELFYELLIRQRAERAKFLAVVEAADKQTPILAGSPTSDDFLKMVRTQQAGSRQLDQIAGRIGDTLQEMKLNQIGSPKSHRLLQEGVIDPIRALNAGPMNELRGMMQSLGGAAPKGGVDKEGVKRLHGEVAAKLRGILEQMSQWESFVDVVNQVAEVIKMQQKVLKATEHARESRTQEVFDEKP